MKNRTILNGAITVALGSVSLSSQAALTTSAVLAFDSGAQYCVYGTTSTGSCQYGIMDIAGSYFAIDTNGSGTLQNKEKIAIAMHDGLHIGAVQPAGGSHSGPPNGSESPGIDEPWLLFGMTGMHQTTSPVTVVSDSGSTKTLDFSGWDLTWDGIPHFNLGGGTQDCGSTTDGICVDGYGNDIGGVYNNGTGLATITCSSSSCSASSSFTLDYTAIVPQADPSTYGGIKYWLHMEGLVAAAVPVPAAAWMMTSGLAGLLACTRRRKSRYSKS